MKKLSIILALALCVTVGAVYATWSYGTQNIQALEDIAVTKTVTIDVSESSKGTLSVSSNSAAVTIAESTTTYVPSITASGTITVLFTPNDGYDGSDVELTIEIQDATGATSFVTYTATEVSQTATSSNSWTVAFDFADIVKDLDFATDYTANPLDTKTEYDAFASSANNLAFTLKVTAA